MSSETLFVENFFATPIFYGAIPDDKFHNQLVALANKCDEAGWFEQTWDDNEWEGEFSKKQSERDNDTTPSTVYFQPNKNILGDNEYVANIIYRHAHGYLDQIGTPKRNLNIHSSWLHKAGNRDTVGWHHHGYKVNRISGVYYIRATGVINGGRTLFKSSNPYNCDYLSRSNRSFKPGVDFLPVERNMIMWPSSLEHRTTPNYTDMSRVVISFNIDVEYEDG